MTKDAEERISRGVLILAASHPSRIASYNRCRKEIPNIVKLTPTELAPSATRPGEPMWHQIVRNIKSHDQEDNNYIHLGFLEHVPRVGFRVTDFGMGFYQKHWAS